jgi:hypothetical protein
MDADTALKMGEQTVGSTGLYRGLASTDYTTEEIEKLGLYMKEEGNTETAWFKFEKWVEKKRKTDAEQLALKTRQAHAAELLAGWKKLIADENQRQIAAMLTAGGMEVATATKIAEQLVHEGGGTLSASDIELIKKLIKTPEEWKVILDNATPEMTGKLGSGPAKDFISYFGSSGNWSQRIDKADDVSLIAQKPGGALSKAGGGGRMNIFHLYGEGPGVMNMIIRAQQAGLLA